MLSAVRLTSFPLPEAHHYKSLLSQGEYHYFAAPVGEGEQDEAGLYEYGLYRTGGSSDSTLMIKDGFLGADVSEAIGETWIPSIDSQGDTGFVFAANDGAHGCEPWITDGSPSGTQLLFEASELGVCPPPSTTRIDGLLEIERSRFSAFAPFVPLADGQLLYWVHNEAESALWRTDVTKPGAQLVATIPSANHGERKFVVELDGVFYFTVSTLVSGDIRTSDSSGRSELWRTDGTQEGTFAVIDVPFPAGYLQVAGDFLYFATHTQSGAGRPPHTLFQSDGTAEGTRELAVVMDLWSTEQVVPLDGEAIALFGEFVSNPPSLERIGANGERTVLKPKGSLGEKPDGLLAHNGYVFFTVCRCAGGTSKRYELWRTDGTPEGTGRVTDLTEDAFTPMPLRKLAEIDGRLFFRLEDLRRSSRDQVWVTDGPNVELFIDGPPETIEYSPGRVSEEAPLVSEFVQISPEQHIFFKTLDLSNRVELWRTDGRTLQLVKEFLASPHALRRDHDVVRPPVTVGGITYLFADDGQTGLELWQTDGTTEGTSLVRDIVPGAASLTADARDIHDLNDQAVFWADNGDGLELYATVDAPAITFSRNETTVLEDGVPAFPLLDPITLRREVSPDTSVVEIAFADGSATGAESDFETSPQRITFLPGETEKTLRIPIIDDSVLESKETFRARLVTIDNASHDGTELVIHVLDNEPRPDPSGDANGDSVVNFVDFTILAANFGEPTLIGPFHGDFDNDGEVAFSDFLIFALNFGRRTSNSI